jgi:atypical dual specificity phosphatase
VTSVLSLRRVALGFGEQTLLEDLAFDVPARGIVALMGAAGVGIELGSAWPGQPAVRGASPPHVRPQASSFQWLVPGALGGMARPGLVYDEIADLAALRALGVRRLVSLEPAAFPVDRLAAHGIAGGHLAIPDMAAPSLPAAYAMIAETEDRIRRGEPTVYHCKGGLGRTGTMLAAHLIARGMAPLHALEELRSIHPRYVQSIAQEQFLDQLAAWLRSAAGDRAR